MKAQVRVMIPVYFDVDMSEEEFLALTTDEREDLGFAALGKYPETDLRNASFEAEDVMAWDLNEEEVDNEDMTIVKVEEMDA